MGVWVRVFVVHDACRGRLLELVLRCVLFVFIFVICSRCVAWSFSVVCIIVICYWVFILGICDLCLILFFVVDVYS